MNHRFSHPWGKSPRDLALVKLEVGYYRLRAMLEAPIQPCSIAQPEARHHVIAPLGRPRSTIVRKVFLHSPLVQPGILQPALARQAGW